MALDHFTLRWWTNSQSISVVYSADISSEGSLKDGVTDQVVHIQTLCFDGIIHLALDILVDKTTLKGWVVANLIELGDTIT